MPNKLKIVLSILGVVLVLLVGYELLKGSPVAGNTFPPANCGGTVTCFTDVAANNVFASVESWLGGSTDATALQRTVTTVNCSAGIYAASSTLAATLNPFNATSTASITRFFGTGQATTSNLLIGTSTAATGLISTSVSPSLVNSTNGLATTTSVFIMSGGTSAIGTGQVTSGTGTVGKIVVGPSEYVSAFSTSTASTVGAANYVPGQSCYYTIEWLR